MGREIVGEKVGFINRRKKIHVEIIVGRCRGWYLNRLHFRVSGLDLSLFELVWKEKNVSRQNIPRYTNVIKME